MVASNVYYLHEDALGSVRLVATATVTIKFSSNYMPYGSNYAMTGTEVFMYTGKMYDASTGLYYLMARYYDPTIGRFVTEDSYTGDDSDPMTLNRYVYARDNPERYTDPNGHMFVVETDSGQEIGGDYLYKPAVVETVTNSESERKRNEYVTDTAMTTYQNTAFGGNNPYGSGERPPRWQTLTSDLLPWAMRAGYQQRCYHGTASCGGGGPVITMRELGAIDVTILLGTLTIASGLATYLTAPLLITPAAPIPVFFAGLTGGLAVSTWDAGVYTWEHGTAATPEDAFASTPLDLLQGILCQFAGC